MLASGRVISTPFGPKSDITELRFGAVNYPIYAPWDWNIYLQIYHRFKDKCREICHTWSIWVWFLLILFLIKLALTKTHPKEAILEKCSKLQKHMTLQSSGDVLERFLLHHHQPFYSVSMTKMYPLKPHSTDIPIYLGSCLNT